MNRIGFAIKLLSFCLLTNFASSQNLNSEIDKLYQVNENEPGFSIAVFKGDKIVFEKQYGIANLDYNVPINNETVFDIASIGKQFTAAAILLLEEEGKLSIKDPVHKYIENLPHYKKGNPTIENLLTQTSGIKEVDPYLDVLDIRWHDYLSQSQVINIITKIKELKFKPGEYYHYTNANYILLANIIENVSGKSFVDFLQERIFLPLEMTNTVKENNTSAIIKNRAIGYTEDEGQYYKTHMHSLVYNGDGQVLTTPRDMFKWHQGIQNSTVGTSELWNKMHTKAKLNDGKTIDFGLGVEFETHNGYNGVGFDGMSRGGFVSKYLYFPELDLAFFTTQNSFSWDFRDRFFKLVDLYIKPITSTKEKDKLQSVKSIAISKNQLQKYEGTYLFYNNEDYSIREIKLKGDNLIYQDTDGEKIGELVPLGNHNFAFIGGSFDSRIKFFIEQDGKQFIFDDRDGDMPRLFKELITHKYSISELEQFVGTYYNKEFQIGKELRLENETLFYYFRNGAWKAEVSTLSKDLLEIPPNPLEFLRDNENEIIGFKMMGVLFEKI
ncbi:serine hydrolase [Ulvibacterium sp.]|uniref:serine hydrolase domain-containing protein n=1 Tax=Ulvibacterium sp. TaxID=2665914 RepID=UPI00261B2C8B|nr:serine hydrolase domain-containing protein [Ulvibacterium sp.]